MLRICICVLMSLCSAAVALAAEPEVKVLVSGLDNPCGVAIQPGTGDVFVSDSGAGRVLRVSISDDGVMSSPVIAGSKIDVYGKGPRYNIGPLGLVFLSKNKLAVGDGGYEDGNEMLRVYKLPKSGQTLNYDECQVKVGPLKAGEASAKGEGNFYGLAATKSGVYITANGDDTKGWVLKAPLKGSTPTDLEAFLATKPKVNVDAPVGITISPEGKLVIGQMGEMNIPKDSLLTMYSEEGELLFEGKSGLFDISAVAYSPKTGALYATDFAWMDTKRGGLFKLEVNDGSVKAIKVLSLDKPTAMTFAEDGTLYITEIGTAKDSDSGKKPGRLIAVHGDL